MYHGAKTAVTTTEGDRKAFDVKVGLHQRIYIESHTVYDNNGNITTELLELSYAGDWILMADS